MSAGAPPVLEGLAGVREIIAVHSAKGGVGKSTVASNLAVTLARLGLKVGLLDGDVHGPSIAHMFGSAERPLASFRPEMALPIERFGVGYLSLANVVTDDAPIIWRGPMVSGALQQLFSVVDWGDRDVLLIDLPPGTGDAILGVGQALSLSGVVAVTTPQELSVADTRRGLAAFAQLNVPVLGLVENMAGFVCECGERALPFGEGGGAAAAESLGIPFLGRLPLDPAVGVAGDAGRPAATDADGPCASAFDSVARAVLAQLALQGRAQADSLDVDWAPMPAGEFHEDPPQTAAGGAPDAAPGSSAPGAPPIQVGQAVPRPEQAVALWQASEDTLGILWGDGRKTFHGAHALRLACPCAACVEEWTGQPMPSLEQVPANVRPVTIRAVGRYAIQPVWSDGHRTGIFAFPDLAKGAGVVDRR